MKLTRQHSIPISVPAMNKSRDSDDSSRDHWTDADQFDDNHNETEPQDLTFSLSLENDEAVIPKKKPLKTTLKFNPNASAFVPTFAMNTGNVTRNDSSKDAVKESYAKESQVIVESNINEFSISYDEVNVKKKVSHDDFEVLKLVGEGGFGKVYQVRHILTQRIYAMKTLRKKFLVNTNNVAYTFVERNVLRKVRHPFICGLHFAFQTKGKVYLVMDFLNGGQIFYHLKRQTMFDETEVQFYGAEITLALSHLHSLGILHRDLKPENILLDGKGHVHLTDFGLARDFQGGQEDKTDTYCGTVEYMAPEMVLGQDYGKEVDWWSLGILLFDMLTGMPPWTDKNEKVLCEMISSSKLKLPSFLSEDCKSLLKGLLQRDGSKRFSSEDVRNHDFFSTLDWQDVFEKNIPPPFVPAVPGGDISTLNFDDKYIKKKGVSATTPSDHVDELSQSEGAMFSGFSYVREAHALNHLKKP